MIAMARDYHSTIPALLTNEERDYLSALSALIDLEQSAPDDPARTTRNGIQCFWREKVLEAIRESVFWSPDLAPTLLARARNRGLVSKAISIRSSQRRCHAPAIQWVIADRMASVPAQAP